MLPQAVWQNDFVFIEIGVQEVDLALSLRREGYTNYLGVSRNARRIAAFQAKHPELAENLTSSNRQKLVRRNNADVLILSSFAMLHLWKYRSVRHAQSVTWRVSFNPLSIVALLGCVFHMISKRYSWPQVVSIQAPEGKVRRIFVTSVLRQKSPGQKSLHFIPHRSGLSGLFRLFDQQNVRYAVLRWFENLPDIEPDEDVDLLVADESLSTVMKILGSQPGIQPCDVYSESGLARSDYCGTPYYPAVVARRILSGAIRHKQLCMVPNPSDYFHSLAYHAVYHKGFRSNLPESETGLRAEGKLEHDYTGILQEMAKNLGIQVDISLEGLHAYLQRTDWGPSPEILARLAVACRRNDWLQSLAKRLEHHVHDQGLAVFVLRQEAVRRGYTDRIIEMIEESGFEILASKLLTPEVVETGAAQTRGGNWELDGPFDISGGPPAAVVVAYDCDPIPLSPRQRRRFRERTNARIFVKEEIRDAIVAELPPNQRFNALHSSDHAADAWHLIEVLAPELLERIRNHLGHKSEEMPVPAQIRRAA